MFMKKITRIAGFWLSLMLFPGAGVIQAQENGHDAVYLRLTKEYILNADGSFDFHYFKKQKLLSYRAIQNLYGETFVVYNPAGQSLKINDCYTIMANGKKVAAPSNSFNEVLPGFAANAPAYNQLREMVITHTGLERNAVENLDYTIHTQKDFYPAMMANEVLAEAEPVQVYIFRIKVPIKADFVYRLYNSDVNPEYITEGGYAIYTWTFKDVPDISQEEHQKGGNELYPRILFSTSGDRNGLYQDLLSGEAFKYQLNDEMKQAVSKVLAENQDKADIFLKLRDEVISNIRLWPMPLRFTGFTCRTPAATWQSNGGTLLEKAVLLCSLLKEAGIPSDPVLVIRQSFFEDKMGNLTDIEDILVRADINGKDPVFVSLNSISTQNLKYDLPGRVLVILNPAESFPIVRTDEFENRATCKGNFVITDKEQVTGEMSVNLGNCFNPWLTLLKDRNKIKTVFSGGFLSADLRDPTYLKFNQEESVISLPVQKEKAFKKDSSFRFFTLPYLNNASESWNIKLLPEKRTTPFEIPDKLTESYEFTFVLPFGMTLFNPQENKEIHNNAGDFEFEIKSEQGKVIIKKSLNLTHRMITPEEYADFKALMDHWNSSRYDQLIIMREKL